MVILIAFISFAAHANFQTCHQVYQAYNLCQTNFKMDLQTGNFLFPNAQFIPCSDGQNLGFYGRLQQMDVASLLLYPYPMDQFFVPQTMNGDPGRLRIDQLYRSTYGQDERFVYSNLVKVPFLGATVKFNQKNGAAAAFRRVGELLLQEAAQNVYVRAFLEPWLSGQLKASTYNWRVVAGTKRLSSHSFGTAVDLNNPEEKRNVYWLWDLAQQKKLAFSKQGIKKTLQEIINTIDEERESNFVPKNLAEVPERIIQIFESQGFIWGGKWYHYDLMHFEYRPEFFPDYTANCH